MKRPTFTPVEATTYVAIGLALLGLAVWYWLHYNQVIATHP